MKDAKLNEAEAMLYFKKLARKLDVNYPIKIDFDYSTSVDSLVTTSWEHTPNSVHLILKNPTKSGLTHECLELKLIQNGTPLVAPFFVWKNILRSDVNVYSFFHEIYKLVVGSTAQNMFLHPQVYSLFLKHSKREFLFNDLSSRIDELFHGTKRLKKNMSAPAFLRICSDLKIPDITTVIDIAQLLDFATTEIAIGKYDVDLLDRFESNLGNSIKDYIGGNKYCRLREHAAEFFDIKQKDLTFDRLEPYIDKTFSLFGFDKPYYVLISYPVKRKFSFSNIFGPKKELEHYNIYAAIDERTKNELRKKDSEIYSSPYFRKGKILQKRDPAEI